MEDEKQTSQGINPQTGSFPNFTKNSKTLKKLSNDTILLLENALTVDTFKS